MLKRHGSGLLATLVVLVLVTAGGVVSSGSLRSSSVKSSQGVPSGTPDPNYSVQTWIPSQTWNGTTLFSNSVLGEIDEVNMNGDLVWSYKVPHPGPLPPIIDGVMVVPGSNDILYAVLDPTSMRGAYEVNRQGQLVWSYLNVTTAHDAVRLPNGDTLLAATHSEDYGPWPYTYPEVFEVNPQGNVVWQWHAKADYANNSNYANIRSKDFGYWTHTNEALRLPDGSTIISLRNFNITAIVDPSGKVLQSFGDPCSGSGCKPSLLYDYPDSEYPLPNGDYIISESLSGNVVEVSPTQNKIVWQWPPVPTLGTPGWLFVLGDQRLPNGNTMVVDGNGQLFEVNPSGQVVWQLRCSCYNGNPPGMPGIKPFFRAERTSYMPPGFTVQSPLNGRTYANGSVPLSLASGIDLGNVTYSVRNNTNGTWMIRNATLLQNSYKNSLTAPTTVHGPSSLNLKDGNYTLRILAGSTGWGYKSFVQQKRINYAYQDVTFAVRTSSTTSSSTTTTTSTAASSSASTSATTSVSTQSSSVTASASSASSTTTTTTISSVESSQKTTTATGQSATASSTSAGAGGIPEFPYQLAAAAVFTFLTVASYLLVRRSSPGWSNRHKALRA